MRQGRDFTPAFAVQRRIGTRVEDQLVGGFSQAIRSGKYADGMPLPGIRQLAKIFGVCCVTAQRAVNRLCREGLLEARPRIGLRVCAPGKRSWRGTVVGVKCGPPGMYHANVVEGALSNVLRRNGWLYYSVAVSPDEIESTEVLDMMLAAPASLVVMYNATKAISAHVAKAGIPFVQIPREYNSPNEIFGVSGSYDSALDELAVALKKAGVRSVLSVYQHPTMASAFAARLKADGLRVRTMRVRPVGGCNTQECVQRAGLLAFDKMLSGAGIREDAVVSNDDYLSAGILAAFDRHGVRMPQDVKFATLANVDLGPVHMQDLTRIESDPAKVGRAVGGWIVDWLDDGKIPSPAFVACTFKRGTTV